MTSQNKINVVSLHHEKNNNDYFYLIMKEAAFTNKGFAKYTFTSRIPKTIDKIIGVLQKVLQNKKEIGNNIPSVSSSIEQCIRDILALKQSILNDDKFRYVWFNYVYKNRLFDLSSTDSDSLVWNKTIESTFLGESTYSSYLNAPFLFVECYVYYSLNLLVKNSQLKDYDYFKDEKNLECCRLLSDNNIDKILGFVKDTDGDLKSLLKLCVWSNKFDLSFSLSEDLDSKFIHELQLLDHNIIADNTEEVIKYTMEHIASKRESRIDIILDNSGNFKTEK